VEGKGRLGRASEVDQRHRGGQGPHPRELQEDMEAPLSMVPQVCAPPLPANCANPPPQRQFTVCPAVHPVRRERRPRTAMSARHRGACKPSPTPRRHAPAAREGPAQCHRARRPRCIGRRSPPIMLAPPQRHDIVHAAYALSGGKGPPTPPPCMQAQPDATSACTHDARRPSPTPPHCAVMPALAAATQPSHTPCACPLFSCLPACMLIS
jgi:hypothetical protein